ncbi:mitochondrial thiamine pyrophosphate carrier-like [Plasmopara halstedii]|uniref:Mitochondrial thiamine pyrophosphate carrier-like n=1 Tax=Plasmopara halstedii TaxID=4781 RepID=A0A0N7L4J1_PLAHL|nr:mitochondrial thiamine pyrophosphate carrier-like [Plasmopara halstedii]CEG38819.1 mitochondrial thiamine pyrophosphate carrier-like [Plasmopara halstedii]|eukprot:XP_024575188.1 mitochondrial thiamine pyrophosphate carrier-like [Plasmopara halstedii]
MTNTNGASITEAAIAGAVSGGITRLVAAPLDLLKIRFQVQPAPIGNGHVEARYLSVAQSVRSIYGEEGLRSFWRGNLAATVLWVSYSALQFATYRGLNRWWEQSEVKDTINVPKVAVSATSGAVAGVTATVLTYPLDFFRTAFAGQGVPKTFPTMYSLMVHIWTTQGFRGFYSGLGATVVQIAPYIGLTFSIYSCLNEMQESHQKEDETGAWKPVATTLSYIGSGAVAGIVSKLAVYPLDTIKKRMQMRNVPRCAKYGVIPMYTSSFSCFYDVLRREGMLGLYKGTVPGLLKSAVAASTTFVTYELTLKAMQHMPNKNQQI